MNGFVHLRDQLMDGVQSCLRVSFQGMEKVDKQVLVAKNMISMEPIVVFCFSEYAYLFQKYVTKCKHAYAVLELQNWCIHPGNSRKMHLVQKNSTIIDT